MRTTVNLDPEAYRLARALASKQGQSLGRVLSDALLNRFRAPAPTSEVVIDEHGFPVLYVGRPITPDEVSAAMDDE